MKRIIITLSVIFSSQLFAQLVEPNKCGIDEITKEYYKNNPQAYEEAMKFEAAFAEYLKKVDLDQFSINNKKFNKTGDSAKLYIIPVVFHILHNNTGPGYYSEAQIRQEIQNMNDFYRARTPYNSRVRDVFKDIQADARIEFRLAKKDPQGNCTNGIDRIYIGYITDKANDLRKFNSWDPQRYLNIWTCEGIKSNSTFNVGGYAYFPNSIPASKYDGPIVSNSLGSPLSPTGSGSFYNTCAHEVGHYLGLPHPFQGSTGDTANKNCQDGDGCFDTPPVNYAPSNSANASNNKCANPNYNSCTSDNPDLPDQQENVMDYFSGSCAGLMFTRQQVARMRFTLENYRRGLWQDANLLSTGVLDTVPTNCAPQASFSIFNNQQMSGFNGCVNNAIEFRDNSFNGTVTSLQWNFGADATPSTSTATNPIVSFSTPGLKTITLTATGPGGTTTKTVNNMINIQPSTSTPVPGNVQFADWDYLNNYLQIGWYYDNETPDPNQFFPIWQRNIGVTYEPEGIASLKLDNNRTSDGFNYSLISPSYDLTAATNPYFSFMYSYAPNFTTFNADQVNWDSQDAMLVSISDDCGKTWKQLNTGDYIGGNARTPNNPPTKVNPLRTTNTALPSNVDYAPINASQWKEFKLTNAGIKKANVRFRVTFMAAGGNNFFLDKMQVVYNTGINELTAEDLRFSVQPNPFSGSTKIAYTLPSNNHVTIKLVDLLGKEVTTVFEGKQSEGEQEVTMDCTKSNIKPGIYFVSFSAGNTALFTKKVIIN